MTVKAPSRAALRVLRSFAFQSRAESNCRYFSQNHRFAQSQPQQDAGSTTHFGFSSIPSSEKASKVGSVFTSVASSYDNMNDFMSLGIHRLWKDSFARSLNPGILPHSSSPPQTILDVAGGTGDVAIRLLDHATLINKDTESKVIVSDINPDMLAVGKKRLDQTSYGKAGRVEFLQADAEKLEEIEDGSIDLYTVAFGIRNFTSIPAALRQAYRVLKPGGVFACLEFSKVENALLNNVYKRWSFGAIPLIGQIVAADRESYQYLVESIERFPSQKKFSRLIEEAGFLIPRLGDGGEGWTNLTAGVAAIHKGLKPLG